MQLSRKMSAYIKGTTYDRKRETHTKASCLYRVFLNSLEWILELFVCRIFAHVNFKCVIYIRSECGDKEASNRDITAVGTKNLANDK